MTSRNAALIPIILVQQIVDPAQCLDAALDDLARIFPANRCFSRFAR